MADLSENEQHMENMTEANRIGRGQGNVFDCLRERILRGAGLLMSGSRVEADLYDTMFDGPVVDATAPGRHDALVKIRMAAVNIIQKRRDGGD